MAFTLRSFLLLCVISGAVTAAWKRCPEGWIELEHRCYIYQSQEMTFLGAEKVCNILGGNLVSIRNSLENAVVFDLIQSGPTAWIGLHNAILFADVKMTHLCQNAQRIENYGILDTLNSPREMNRMGMDQQFLWTDGSIVKFTAFNSEGPDGLGNCVQFSRLDGFWQDHPCDLRAPFVCIQDVNFFGGF